jgi:hypothetical protein
MNVLERVVQLRCKTGGLWESGSGYLLGNSVVLTAAHVVAQADPVTSIEVRPFRSTSWSQASIVWSDPEVDVALLRTDLPAEAVSSAPPAWGAVKGTLAPAEAIGFPAFGVREDLRDTEHLLGQLRLLSGVRTGSLQVEVIGQKIEAHDWRGMSGATLFCKGRLVGVVIEAIRDTGRLVVQPLAALADRKDVRNALGTEVAVETIVAMTGPQPALVSKLLQGAPASRLAYSARRTPLLGREREIDQLRGFLEDGRRFLWWMITGGSGSGKSRLALESTLRHWGDWWSGFLADEQDPGFWSSWKPEWPTLMVVDYVGTRAAAIGRMVNTLQERAADLNFPVRVLLIARSVEEPWWREFLGRGSRTTRETILGARFEEPLHLSGLSPRDSWALIEHLLSAANVSWSASERDYLMAALSRIDPGGSPLYAMLLADAFAHTEKGSWDSRSATWDAAQLVEDVIERERAQWEALGTTAEDERALALATILWGLDLEVIGDERVPGLLPAPEDYRPEIFQAITGKPAEAEVPPLGPSLIGESFVLSLPASKIDRTLRNLARLAFELDAVAASQFVLHAAMDFPGHANLNHLLPGDPAALLAAHPGAAGGDDASQAMYMASALAVTYASLGMRAEASLISQTMLDWLQSRPDAPELQEGSANTLSNLIATAAVRGELEFALATVNTLGGLWTTTRVPAFGVALANALFSVGTVTLDFGHDALTQQAVAGLERLAAEAPYPEVGTARARLLVNVAVRACRQQNLEIATARCAELLQIQVDGPLRSELSRLQVKCLRNVCRALAISGDLEGAANTYTELARIVEREPLLTRWQVVALADLIEGACEASALDLAWSRFEDLRGFGEFAEIDSEARIKVCHALGTLALRLCRVPDCARAEEVYFAWRGDDTDRISRCRAVWAQVGANLVDAYLRIQDVAGARRIHADIRRLLAVDPTRQEVGSDLGRATQVLLTCMAEAGLAAEAKAMLTDHRRDLQALREDRESLYITTVFYFMVALTNPGGDLEQARDVLWNHRAVLTSEEFSRSVRDQFGDEFAGEWSKQLGTLLGDGS